MNTSGIKLAIIWMWTTTSLAVAQPSSSLGILPSVNLNGRINERWSVNSKVEARFPLIEHTAVSPTGFSPSYELTDLSFIGARKVGLDNRIGIGYLLRLRENEFHHRLIQQFTIVQRLSGFRLAHRFSSDQTISPTESMEFRLRYRISSEIPLNGKSADPKEAYFKLNNEYLGSWQNGTFDTEIRLVPLIGYTATPRSKFEAGVDYRARSLFTDSMRNNVWISLNWFYQLDFKNED